MTETKKFKPSDAFYKFFATGAYTGYLPTAPGSWGSFLACAILWIVWPQYWYYQLLAILLFYPIAVFFAGKGVKYFGPDGRQIVIDEMIGQAAALFMAPKSIVIYLLAFVLFRIFDVVKPEPARSWEKLHGGVGIVADDIAAGVYAAVVLHLILALLKSIGVELNI